MRYRLCVLLALGACSIRATGGKAGGGEDNIDPITTADSPGTGTGTVHDSDSADPSSFTSGAGQGSGAPVFDVGGVPGDSVGGDQRCKVVDNMNAAGTCRKRAPPNSFTSDVQWAWEGDNDDIYSVVSPLVANLTDDNSDGEIDLCDTPDVVVVAWGQLFGSAHIYVLDGASGVPHFRIETPVHSTTTPALGDIDGDGLVEIVTQGLDTRLVAFDHEGGLQWMSDAAWTASGTTASLALGDLDNNGDVEVIAGNKIFDHNGILVQTLGSESPVHGTSVAADLDGDGDLEVLLGNSAYHHDGGLVWRKPLANGFPQVADLDGDGLPEVLLTGADGLSLLEHDGTVVFGNLTPTNDVAGQLIWSRPATVHDFDGDGQADFAMSSADHYTVYRADASIMWSAPVHDATGIAAGTAFDFLGDGVAEAMYADERSMFVFGPDGGVQLRTPRPSRTGTEYPVVADIDNDGSAEIIVVSNQRTDPGAGPAPTVQAIRDIEDRWVQARRIWNQHTYHVTNVREDGTIPQHEPPSWKLLNTFRTNAQIENGELCSPTPAG